jgi:tRNA G18 (ribose-2'-O)-methylase SpoU
VAQKRGQNSNKSSTGGGIFIEGQGPIEEYLRYRPHALKEILYFSEKELQQLNLVLQSLGAASKIPLRQGSKTETGTFRRTPVAKVDVRTVSFDDVCTDSQFLGSNLIVAMDHVQDPRNLGAIARSAAFFGVRYLLVPRDRQVLLTQASIATAQGGFALVDLVETTNLRRSLEMLKQKGFWLLGADADGQNLNELIGKFEKQILILGSEEQGLTRLVRSGCDCIISIPGGEKRVESLNVAVAGGILMQALSVRKSV